jgi:alpha-amylase
VFAFSRLDRHHQREYVVALNNSQSTASADVATYAPRHTFRRIYGAGAARTDTDAHRRLHVRVPPLSAVVYESTARVPRSSAAPRITLERPRPADVSRGRMHVRADVAGSSFYEVTFQARAADGRWRSIGTDDSAPYQVFHDTSSLATGTRLRYRAVVLDNSGHARLSARRDTVVPAPTVTVSAPQDGGTVSTVDPVTVRATVDPERSSESVRFQRSLAGGPWTTLGTDRSSPAYTVTDDVSDLAVGTAVRYRATLLERGARPSSALRCA